MTLYDDSVYAELHHLLYNLESFALSSFRGSFEQHGIYYCDMVFS